MKIELPKPAAHDEPMTSTGGGITSPYADPPWAPVFVIHTRGDDGAGSTRLTLTEDEARTLHAALSVWVAELPSVHASLKAATK